MSDSHKAHQTEQNCYAELSDPALGECTRSSQTLPVDGRAEAHADGQIDGLADEFLAGALSEEKQFKPLGERSHLEFTPAL
ncbi:uncharacterized [Tachysurus ichikawai]